MSDESPALKDFEALLEEMERRGVKVHPERCLRERHQRSECHRCADVCPIAAIDDGQDGLSIDVDSCTGCGACATACPAGAIDARQPDRGPLREAVEAQARSLGEVSFACRASLDAAGAPPGAATEVRCIARVDEALLLAAVAAGARVVRLVDRGCAACTGAKGRDAACRTARSVNELLGLWRIEPRVTVDALLPAAPDGSVASRAGAEAAGGAVSRRAFFGLMRKRSASATSAVIAHATRAMPEFISGPEAPAAPAAGPSPAYLPVKWRALPGLLRALPGTPSRSHVPAGLWGDVEIGAGCNGCRICATFCPTGALAAADWEGGMELTFRPANCTHCGLCAAICPRGEIVLPPEVELERILDERDEILVRRDGEALLAVTGTMEERLRLLLKTHLTV